MCRIDCAKPAGDDPEFLDHSGFYSAPATNVGRLMSRDGMAYRETGPSYYDYFAHRIHLKERGRPYLIEVIVPDNEERYVKSGVVETYPLPFCNNIIGRGYFNVTGTCLTGRDYPLTRGKRRLRYIYHPMSLGAAVVVMNGGQQTRAAACEINVYSIEGGLPALDVPATARRFGTHNERLSLVSASLACENPLENDLGISANTHQDGWYHWYKALLSQR